MEREDGNPVLAPVGRAFKALLAAFERDVGISGPRYFLLEILVLEDEAGLSQGEVCRRFRVDPSRVTRMAKAAQEEGLIQRVRGSEDSRVMWMYPTDEGRRVYEEAAGRVDRFQSRMSAAVGEQELEDLRRTLGKLERAAEEEMGSPREGSAREVEVER